MTVLAMSHGELSRYDTLLRATRCVLRIQERRRFLGCNDDRFADC